MGGTDRAGEKEDVSRNAWEMELAGFHEGLNGRVRG